MKPSHLLDRVKQVLESKPETRDWDSKLVFQVWGKELFDSELLNINCMTLQEIDSRIETGKFSSYESICRFARMIKSKYPELKGKLNATHLLEVLDPDKKYRRKRNNIAHFAESFSKPATYEEYRAKLDAALAELRKFLKIPPI